MERGCFQDQPEWRGIFQWAGYIVNERAEWERGSGIKLRAYNELNAKGIQLHLHEVAPSSIRT
jgi:hypothetical protein